MARVNFEPYPSVAPTGAPGGDYENIPSNPGMFGGLIAQSEEKLGQGIESAGNAGLEIETEKARMNAHAHVAELYNWTADQISDLHSKYSQQQGKAAWNGLGDYKKGLNDIFQQGIGQANSPYAKELYEDSARRLMSQYYAYGVTHADQQNIQWQKKTASDSISTHAGLAGVAALQQDWQSVDRSLNNQAMEVRNYWEVQGYDPQTIEVEVNKQRGATVKNLVETAATNDKDPDAISHALNIFEHYSGQIDPASRLDISKWINAKAQARSVDRLSNYYINGSVAGVPSSFVQGIKSTEGYRETPYWDVKQWNVGYGTKASGPNERPDRAELETRFEDRLSDAANFVDSVNPHLDPGTRAAMASLTYNTGQGWASSGLGEAIRTGNLGRAQQLFLQYNNVGGHPDQAVAQRRAREAEWFGRQDAQTGTRLDADGIVTRIATDPLFKDRPELQKAVIANVMQKASVMERAQAIENKQNKERSDGAELEMFKRIHSDDKGLTVQDIFNTPGLSKEAIERLTQQYEARAGVTKADHTYGSGFYDMYRRVHLPEGDPERITDPSQLYGHVGPQQPKTYLDEATRALTLTPQEQNLYRYHLQNLGGAGKVIQPNGNISTILEKMVEADGRFYTIPSVWDGKAHSTEETIEHARAAGWDKWPSYATEEEAERRYDAIHSYANRDVESYLAPQQQGDLTVGGVDKLVSEIQGRKTPEGTAESEMKAQFLKNARAQITGSDEGLHIHDPKGDELYLRFLAQVLPAYDQAKHTGKSAAQMFNPDSPDYLGKAIDAFRRPMDQWFGDMVHDQPGAAQPGAQPQAFNPASVKTVDDAIAAYRRGDITKAQADDLAIKNGWGFRKPPPPTRPEVPMSQ